jgi:putative SOS response-associated peptidase YedK
LREITAKIASIEHLPDVPHGWDVEISKLQADDLTLESQHSLLQNQIAAIEVELQQLVIDSSALTIAKRASDLVGNLAPMPGVFPDYPAPVVRNTDNGNEMVTMRWGMPPPPRTGGPAVTNIRNTSSPHWRMWLKPENRCLVPANSFAEYAPEPNPETKKKDVVWFALNDDRPLFAFAGIWTTFNGERGTK